MAQPTAFHAGGKEQREQQASREHWLDHDEPTQIERSGLEPEAAANPDQAEQPAPFSGQADQDSGIERLRRWQQSGGALLNDRRHGVAGSSRQREEYCQCLLQCSGQRAGHLPSWPPEPRGHPTTITP
jgi:hypothetical protein